MTSIDDLRLSLRTQRCLLSDNILTIEQLRHMKDRELLRISGFGRRCLDEIKGALVNWDKDERDGIHRPSKRHIVREMVVVKSGARPVRPVVDELVLHLRGEGRQLDQWAHELEQLRRFERDRWRFEQERDRLLRIEEVAHKVVALVDDGVAPNTAVVEELRIALEPARPS